MLQLDLSRENKDALRIYLRAGNLIHENIQVKKFKI